MKKILYAIILISLVGCSNSSQYKNFAWEPYYWAPEDIIQLKLHGDSIKYTDYQLIEHSVHQSDFGPIRFTNDTLFLWDTIPFYKSQTPYNSGIDLPNIIPNQSKKIKDALITHIAISYDSINGYDQCFFGATKGSFKDAAYYVGNEYHVQLSMDKDLPIKFYDSIRLNLSQYGTKNILIPTSKGLCVYKIRFPLMEEINETSHSIEYPPSPPSGYASICESNVEFLFVDLSTKVDYQRIIDFATNNTQNVIVLLYKETNTIEFVFQPYFKFIHEIDLMRNKYSIQEFKTEFDNLDAHKRTIVRKKFPIRIILANKKLLEQCE